MQPLVLRFHNRAEVLLVFLLERPFVLSLHKVFRYGSLGHARVADESEAYRASATV